MGLDSLSRSCCRVILAIGVAACSGHLARAQQTAAAPEPAFEVASIRPAHFTTGCFSMLPPGGTHYAVTCLTLRDLIAMAWKLHPDYIQGGDAHALDTYYDLTAVTPGDQPWTRDTIPPMLRQLLIERFHVVVHPGTKQVSGYALVVAKGGPKLKPTDVDVMQQGQKAGEPFQNFLYPGYIHSPGANLDVVAALLGAAARGTVVDRTGISGVFMIDLHYAPENSTESDFPDFFTAVQEQLGLKLQPEKVSVNTLVVDHADSEPTAN